MSATRYVMANTKGWGNYIGWLNFDKLRVHGHITPMIKVGDELVAQMESGNDFIYRVTKVDQMANPRDQFFADVEPVGYLKDEAS